MVDIDKIERAAEAAISTNADDPADWYPWEGVIDGVDYSEDAEFIAACRPQTIIKLIAVVRAAKATMTVDQDDTVESLAADLTLYAALGALK